MTDGELIRAVQQGDPAALSELYQRHVPGVWRFVWASLGKDRAGCEDVVSETFLAALRTVANYDSRQGSVYCWLLGIARHKLRDHWRKAGRQREDTGLEVGGLTDPQAGSPDAPLLVRELQEAVLRTLERLDDEERLVLEWKYVEACSVREIATRLGRTEKAVEALLYRARASFRTHHPSQRLQRESGGD